MPSYAFAKCLCGSKLQNLQSLGMYWKLIRFFFATQTAVPLWCMLNKTIYSSYMAVAQNQVVVCKYIHTRRHLQNIINQLSHCHLGKLGSPRSRDHPMDLSHWRSQLTFRLLRWKSLNLGVSLALAVDLLGDQFNRFQYPKVECNWRHQL